MRYVEFELTGFKHVRLANIKFIKMTPQEKFQLLLGTNGSGKAQPLSSFIKIPGGWSTMGDMQVGTEVIAKDGSVTKVNAVSPQGKQQIYKIIFTDGRTARATGDHLWKIYKGGSKYPIVPQILTTLDVIELLKSKTYHHLLWIDLPEPEQSKDVILSVDPYILGVILGDGNLHSGVKITNPDEFIMKKINSKLTNNVFTNLHKSSSTCPTFGLTRNRRYGPKSNYIINYLRDSGLIFKRSYEKFIPEEYLFSSAKQRLELLQGLMDTDGTVDKQGTCSYCSTSLELAQQVQYIIRSLGGIASISKRTPNFTYKGEKREGRLAYQVNIRYKKPSELFTVPRKQERTNDNNQYSATLKLRILSIIEDGFEEAQCISIDHPDRLYVTNDFIVTHNSALLKELSPLPAISQNYNKEGKKRIVIEHHGHTYELTSVFSPSQRHTFIKDGDEDLNPGGTASVQKELVKKVFNVTPDVHELMTGSIVFTKMGPGERRYWLTRLSDTSYNYALGVHQKLKERHRDVQGAIKMNQSRAVQEANKLLSEDQEQQLRAEIKEYREILEKLLTLKSPSQYFRSDIEKELTHVEDELSTLSRQIIRIRGKFLNLEGFTSFETIDDMIIKITSSANSLNFVIDRVSKEIQTLQDTIQALTKANISNFQELDTKRSELTKTIEALFGKVDKNINFSDPVNALQVLNTVHDSLTDIISQLKPNPGTYSRDNYQQLQELILKTQHTLQVDEAAYIASTVKKKAFEEAKREAPINCPKCDHQWHLGYDPKTYEEVCMFLNVKFKAIEETKLSLKVMEESLEDYRQYFTLYRAYSELTRGWTILDPLWSYITTSEMIFKNPNSILYLIDRVKGSMQIQMQVNELQKQLAELNELKVATIALESDHIEKTKAKIAALEEELFQQNESLRNNRRYIQQLKDYKDVARFIKEKETYLESLIVKRGQKFEILLEEIKQTTLNEMIRYVQLELTKREQQLSQVDVQKGLVENIRRQIKELEEETIVLAAMVKELSPSEGLIAKGLLGFINIFVKQMNSFIRKAWLYPMEIIPLLPDSDNGVDLDYKFSLQVNNNEPIPDIKLASSAMSEIINLAFVIVAMKYLGLSDAPLLLDEFAASMDSAHRASAFHTIRSLITQSDFSQIFIVSHFEECYGSLANADITVLCSKNIILPKGTTFNRHTVIH